MYLTILNDLLITQTLTSKWLLSRSTDTIWCLAKELHYFRVSWWTITDTGSFQWLHDIKLRSCIADIWQMEICTKSARSVYTMYGRYVLYCSCPRPKVEIFLLQPVSPRYKFHRLRESLHCSASCDPLCHSVLSELIIHWRLLTVEGSESSNRSSWVHTTLKFALQHAFIHLWYIPLYCDSAKAICKDVEFVNEFHEWMFC